MGISFFEAFIVVLKQHLCNFLLFVTGKPQCDLQSIQENFHVPESDFRRRLTSSTCSMTVSVPAIYI